MPSSGRTFCDMRGKALRGPVPLGQVQGRVGIQATPWCAKGVAIRRSAEGGAGLWRVGACGMGW